MDVLFSEQRIAGDAVFAGGDDAAPNPPTVYGSGGAQSSYHDEVEPRQYRIRVHAENDEEEQIILNLIMEFARHVL
jgi:hypothetical protein